MTRKLRLMPAEQREVGGVCAGIAYYVGCPVWLVRLIWFFPIFAYGFGLGLYFLLYIFMPEWDEVPEDFASVTGD